MITFKVDAGVAQSVERVALIPSHLKVAGSIPAFGFSIFDSILNFRISCFDGGSFVFAKSAMANIS